MAINQDVFDTDRWIIWNGTLGVMDRVSIGQVEQRESAVSAWLDEPYDMVGPFSLDELIAAGRIDFAACIVMSQEYWQREQVALRQAANHARRAFQRERFERFSHYQQRSQSRGPQSRDDERFHRQTLKLDSEGPLKTADIKSAFRRLAQKLHPDAGGSHEQFVKITEARDALLSVANL